MKRIGALAAVFALAVLIPSVGPSVPASALSEAATPASGSITAPAGATTWTGPGHTSNNAASSLPCDNPGVYCSNFTLTVNVPASYWLANGGGIRVDISWTLPADDYDLRVFQGTALVKDSVGSPPGTSESVFIPAATGVYRVETAYSGTSGGPGYAGSAQVVTTGAPAPGPTYDATTVSFGPATIVSAHFLGAEPQVTVERPVAETQPGALDPRRIFVDWPLTSRSNIGQLSRSTDNGDSFRLLLDLSCAFRSRPNCLTGGGGDTENDVNPANGHLFFADQEVLAQESESSSVDHGDSFPPNRQFAATNSATGVDRQWLAAIDPSLASVGGQAIESFFSYHVPGAGEYVHAITQQGIVVPEGPVTQIPDVGQSGQIRADSSPLSKARGWIYQPFNGFTANNYAIASVKAQNFQVPQPPANDDADGSAWKTTEVSPDGATSFPWLAIDQKGNLYATWDSGSQVYFSAAPIDDVRNDPTQGGRPASYWTPAQQVNPPTVTSAVFPEVIAGDSGKIGVTYLGYEGYRGSTDDAEPTQTVYAYVSVVQNALPASGQAPVVSTGRISNRPVHEGNVCTSGTACLATGKDRSFADMIDVGVDADGRLGVVYMDNYGTFGDAYEASGAKGAPFVHFAKQTVGPSILDGKGPLNVATPLNGTVDPTGDGTWPNTAVGKNLPAFDLTGASVKLEGSDIVARVRVSDLSVDAIQRDLAAYNAVSQTNPPAERAVHMIRFNTPKDIIHLDLETLTDGTQRFYGGRLDGNDGLPNPASPTSFLGAGYHTDTTPVIGTVEGDTVVLRTPASAYGIGAGTPLYSVTGFTMAGPAEANEVTLATPMRTIDATPPADGVLGTALPAPSGGEGVPGAEVPVPPAPSTTFSFAEGTTLPGFEEYLLFYNPAATAVDATIRYALENGTAPDQKVSIPAQSRVTVHVADAPGVGRGQVGVGAFVTASSPIVAERAMYFDASVAGLPANGAHAAVGAASAQGEWDFAEGSTQDGFREFLTLANPGSLTTTANITYGVEGGGTVVRSVPVAGGQRVTVNVNEVLGPVVGHSTKVTSDRPILAERPIYFDTPIAGLPVSGGHVAFGGRAAHDLYFAEGTVLTDFREFVTLDYILGDGSVVSRSATVAPGSRTTVQVFNPTGSGIGTDVSDPLSRGVSLHVHTDAAQGVVAERPVYFDHAFPGLAGTVSDGHTAPGSVGLAKVWDFAEGTTLPGFDTFVTILNPGADQQATISYFTDQPADGPQVRPVALPAHSRTTIQVFGPASAGGLGLQRTGVAFAVTAADPVLVERPLYVSGAVGDLPSIDGGTDVIGLAAG